LARLQQAGQGVAPAALGPGSAVFTGKAHAEARDGGVAIGQAAHVHLGRDPGGPQGPGRSGR
jgi:hypothetical protein